SNRLENGSDEWSSGPDLTRLINKRMELPMSIKTKLVALTVAAITVVAASAAEAKPKINPVAVGVGVLGAVAVTSAIAASQPSHAYGYPARRCYWKPHFNVFGQFDGHVRICPTYY